MEKNYMKISEFSKKVGISRKNLIFYDKVGVLKPHFTNKNGYRYYSQEQILSAYLLFILRKMGISIDEIKNYDSSKSSESLISLFKKEQNNIDQKIKKLLKIRETMSIYTNLIQDTSNIDINKINIVYQNKQKIFVGPDLIKEDCYSFENANINFYKFCNKHDIDLIYPFGICISKESINTRKFEKVKKCFFYVPSEHNDIKSSGYYLVGYTHGKHTDFSNLLNRMTEYANNHNFKLTSDAYIDYPENEMTSENRSDLLIRAMIKVVDN